MCCIVCKREPSEIFEYISEAQIEETTPEEFVKENEGTYNEETGEFYCTKCYIKAGMPLNKF